MPDGTGIRDLRSGGCMDLDHGHWAPSGRRGMEYLEVARGRAFQRLSIQYQTRGEGGACLQSSTSTSLRHPVLPSTFSPAARHGSFRRIGGSATRARGGPDEPLVNDAKRKRTESPNTRRERDGRSADAKRRRTTPDRQEPFAEPGLGREPASIPDGDAVPGRAMAVDRGPPALDACADTAVRHLVSDAPDHHPLYRSHLQTLLTACRKAPQGL